VPEAEHYQQLVGHAKQVPLDKTYPNMQDWQVGVVAEPEIEHVKQPAIGVLQGEQDPLFI